MIMKKLKFDGILHPIHSGRFHVSYSNNGIPYDVLSVQTLSADYDIFNRTITCKIELDVLGYVEQSLIDMMSYVTIRPQISINRKNGRGEVIYSLVCNTSEIVSCEVPTSYVNSGGVAAVYLTCKVKEFEIIPGPNYPDNKD